MRPDASLQMNMNSHTEKQPAQISLPMLLIAIGITLAIVIYPHLLSDSQQRADHPAAMLMFWSMSAGYVRGVGFIPRHTVPRWLLGGPACLITLALAVIRLYLIQS